MKSVRTVPFAVPLAERLADGAGHRVSLYWLGQAGFVIDAHGRRYVIDPYLSDSLAKNYRGTGFSHERLAPASVTPAELGDVDLVLCTHQHTDHMDGETLRALAERLPTLKFVVPAASRALAMERIGVDGDRLIEVDAGQRLSLPGVELHVLRAAHETLELDENGHHRFLGYGLDFGNVRIFHSGDTVPFDGQDEEIRAFAPDLALLPVNGRSGTLRAAGFAGNFTLSEAVALCGRCTIPSMIAHHFGMFAFNTIATAEIDAAILGASTALLRACHGAAFCLDDT